MRWRSRIRVIDYDLCWRIRELSPADFPEPDFGGVSRFHLSGNRVNQDLAADRDLYFPLAWLVVRYNHAT